MMSFVNYISDTLVLFLPTMKPSNNLLTSTLNNTLLSTSATMVKRKGDNESPC